MTDGLPLLAVVKMSAMERLMEEIVTSGHYPRPQLHQVQLVVEQRLLKLPINLKLLLVMVAPIEESREEPKVVKYARHGELRPQILITSHQLVSLIQVWKKTIAEILMVTQLFGASQLILYRNQTGKDGSTVLQLTQEHPRKLVMRIQLTCFSTLKLVILNRTKPQDAGQQQMLQALLTPVPVTDLAVHVDTLSLQQEKMPVLVVLIALMHSGKPTVQTQVFVPKRTR